MMDKELAKRIEYKKEILEKLMKGPLTKEQEARLKELKKRQMISYIYNSEAIEGSDITIEQVTEIVEEYNRKHP